MPCDTWGHRCVFARVPPCHQTAEPKDTNASSTSNTSSQNTPLLGILSSTCRKNPCGLVAGSKHRCDTRDLSAEGQYSCRCRQQVQEGGSYLSQRTASHEATCAYASHSSYTVPPRAALGNHSKTKPEHQKKTCLCFL